MTVCVLISSSDKDTRRTGRGPALVILFYLNYLFKDPICKYNHILRSWGLELQHKKFEGIQFSPNTRKQKRKYYCKDIRMSHDKNAAKHMKRLSHSFSLFLLCKCICGYSLKNNNNHLYNCSLRNRSFKLLCF